MLSNEEPADTVILNELDLLGNLLADYEEEHHPMLAPTLADMLKYRMAEMSLTQDGVAKLLGISQSRVSQYLTGKSEPPMKVARAMSRELNIDAGIILGVG